MVQRELSALELLLKAIPNPAQPGYYLMLDGSNEIRADAFQDFVEELESIVCNWHNIRILVTGRILPDFSVFSAFESAELCGVPVDLREEILQKNDIFPHDEKLLELLRSPLFLKLYLQNHDQETDSDNRGQILDAYIQNLRSPVHDKSRLYAFVVRFSLPIAANQILHTFTHTLTRADLIDAATIAVSLYLENERVYQNYIVPLHFRRELLLNAMHNTDISELLTMHSGFLEVDEAGQQRFTHQYFRDYFTARHYVNLLEVFSLCFDGRHVPEIQTIFDRFDLGFIWFPGEDGDEIYRLIGEICGDDRNIPEEDYFVYKRTVLDDFLDICRICKHFRMVENVMRIMHLTRNGVVCGVDFSGLSLPLNMPESTYFSLHGMFPCDFSDTKVYGVFDSSVPADSRLLEDGVTLLPESGCPLYYQNCDFSGADYFPIVENREILRRYGALV